LSPSFIHLHLHSEYSLVDGTIRIPDLIRETAAMRMPALALTELGNLYSLVKFYRACQEAGIKPIIGSEVRIMDTQRGGRGNLVLLCQNQTGYLNLSRLITRSYTEGQTHGVPWVSHEWLQGATDGLLALSGAAEGDVGQAIRNGRMDLASGLLARWLTLFPDRYYLELQRTGREHDNVCVEGALELATKHAVPVVATNDVRFLQAADFEAHEARVCIHQGAVLNDPRRARLYSEQQYLRSPEEMALLFQDLPEAIENTIAIAMRCNLDLSFGAYYLPEFPVPEGFNQGSWLRREAEAGLERLEQAGHLRGSAGGNEPYRQRLASELAVIIEMGFPGYFLIVADFIRWAKQHDIPVGPGRGSGAGSLVAYALGITELDPIRYELLFERFLNPERVSLPDFDVDFCMDRRDEVIEYVAERYGRDRVSQIITFGSMAAKAVVRDVGRVLGHPYGFVDQIAKLIPFELDMTLERALEQEELLRLRYEKEEEVATLIDLAMKLEGLSRNAGRHAGGLVIAPRPLTEYMPLYCEQGSAAISTQFDMGDVESIGLVKFDFLGLRTLTIIHNAVKDINRFLLGNGETPLAVNDLPLDDPETFRLIQRMETTAVFQLESDGMKKLIKRLRPDTFNDLIALVALFRPGPLQSGMVDDYIDRKHGSRVDYPHPKLEQVLGPTYGVILYQEQVMQIAQILAGYSLGSADLLRRAMGKKKPEEMAKQRGVFVQGAVARGVEERKATHIFDLMEKFAGYGFNKSHSAAYALLAYQTAWLKAHYPAAFMSAVLSADMDNTDKIVMLREELRQMRIRLVPPAINRGEYRFQVIDAATIQFGLGAIKGVGAAAIENILRDRHEHGMYHDLFDLCRRVDNRKVNKRVYEALVRAGALDELGPGRSTLMASLPKATQLAEQHLSNRDTGQDDLFGLGTGSGSGPANEATADTITFVAAPDWDEHERLQWEKETLGFYLEGHPISRYEPELAEIVTVRLRQVKKDRLRVAGYVENIRIRTGTRGRMAEIRLDDRTARMQLTLYSEVYDRYRTLLNKDRLIIVCGEAVEDDYHNSGYYIRVDSVHDLDEIRNRCGVLRLTLNRETAANGMLQKLKAILQSFRGDARPVVFEYDNGDAVGLLSPAGEWKVRFDDALLGNLRGLLGADQVHVDYRQLSQYFSS
jgi:DNA polymerase-3 subunit alpha